MSNIFEDTLMSTHYSSKEIIKESVVKSAKTPLKSTITESSKAKSSSGLYFDDKRANALFTKFFTTNYKNGKSVIVESASKEGKKLILEAKVITKLDKVKKSKFICENFSLASKKAEFTEEGAFTESKDKAPAFTMDFSVVSNKILPMSLNYDYRLTEGTNRYRVVGKTLLESRKK